ncbi:sugar kinase [Caulobacter henricii]|uniref:2-dehydro-3-deoxygluconokinase n=1 Tax=Caulobacter henricii TaxID=69395 RepID=A0A0P0P0U7_9CAUL|nr:sugar kinase [Caulobacter henricii]ALL14060.1 2-dehydro-3-deoxygluconokinase [Caulobacter henricii]
MAKITVLGECMVEMSPDGLSGDGAPLYRMGFAGDTFNTAVYMARLGDQVAYCTALGQGDPFSDGVLAAMRREGLDTRLIREVSNRLPGLYAIVLDDSGERKFHYWRERAPIRDLFSEHTADQLIEAARASDLVYLSGVTLAVIGDIGRARLKDVLAYVHSLGVAVALDFNYRPALWPGPEAARAALDGVVPACRYISLSSEDTRPLYGREAEDLAAQWAAGGGEVVARDESHAVNVHRPEGRTATPAPPRVKALDTTGAGDSFNAAYLSARLAGLPIETAVARAHALAGRVVTCRGAIIPAGQSLGLDALPAN